MTVIERDELCELWDVWELGVDGGGFCALTTATTPNAMAAHVPDQVRTFMSPPWRFAISRDAVQLSDQKQREADGFEPAEFDASRDTRRREM